MKSVKVSMLSYQGSKLQFEVIGQEVQKAVDSMNGQVLALVLLCTVRDDNRSAHRQGHIQSNYSRHFSLSLENNLKYNTCMS